jgi:hypothetical protein
MDIPGVLKFPGLPGLIYGFIQSIVKDNLHTFYHLGKNQFMEGLSLVEMGMKQFVSLFEIQNQRDLLKEKCGGSDFLVKMAEALSKDCLNQITKRIGNTRSLIVEVLKQLGLENPGDEDIEKMQAGIQHLLPKIKKNTLSVDDIAEAYHSAFNLQDSLPLSQEQNSGLQKHLDEIRGFFYTEEGIADMILGYLPGGSADLREQIIHQVHAMLKSEEPGYKKNREFLQLFIEGTLLKVLTTVAAANPPEGEMTTDIIIVKKFKDLLLTAYTEMVHTDKDEKQITDGLNRQLMTNVLGLAHMQDVNGQQVLIASEELAWLPAPLQKLVLGDMPEIFNLSEILTEFLKRTKEHLQALSSENTSVKEAKEALKRFDKNEIDAQTGKKIKRNQQKSNAEIVISDLISMVMPAVLNNLANKAEGADQAGGVMKISKSIESLVEGFVSDHWEVAKVFQGYTETPTFQKMLGEDLSTLAGQSHKEDKDKVEEIIVNLLMEPLNHLAHQATEFGKKENAEPLRKTMGSVFKAVADHFEILNLAKKKAKEDGRTKVLHSDFVAAAGDDLHPAVPKKAISYQKSLGAIQGLDFIPALTADQLEALELSIKQLVKNEAAGIKVMHWEDVIDVVNTILFYHETTKAKLTAEEIERFKSHRVEGKSIKEMIEFEAEEHYRRRRVEAYDPSSTAALKLMFPNGMQDLTFVEPARREAIWNLFESQLMPIILPITMETIIASLDDILLSSLQATRDNFNQKVDYPPPPRRRLTEGEKFLGKATGQMLTQVLETLDLPPAIKNFIVDAEGRVTPEMEETLGLALGAKFNEAFIEETLKSAFKSTATRDSQGKAVLSYDDSPQAVKQAKAAASVALTNREIRKVTRELVTAMISNMIRTRWATAHFNFEMQIKEIFGDETIVLSLKNALDAVFGFVFLTLIGNILKVCLWPAKRLFQEIVCRLILDKNIKIIRDIFQDVPEDQPEGYNYTLATENLIFQAVQAAAKAIEESETAAVASEKETPLVINDEIRKLVELVFAE